MDNAARVAGSGWMADAFLRTDQREFGDAWHYDVLMVRSLRTRRKPWIMPPSSWVSEPRWATACVTTRTAVARRRVAPSHRETSRFPRPAFPMPWCAAVICHVSSSTWFRRPSCERGEPETKGGRICRMSRASWKSSKSIRTRRRSTSIGGRQVDSGPSTPWTGRTAARERRRQRWSGWGGGAHCRVDPPDLAAGAYHPAGRLRLLQRQNHELVRGEPRRLRVRPGT
jgi:hypothetical protein